MRRSVALDALFPTIRGEVLSAALLDPDRWWFLTELAEHLGVTPSSLQRELESLARAGLLQRRKDGRRTYFRANAASPIFPELRDLVEKTAGIIPVLRDTLKDFRDRIELALVYGSMARGREHSASDVDLMVVGKLRQIDLVSTLRKLEGRFRREINVTLFSPEEFRRKRSEKDHFISTVLKGKTIILKGALNELEETPAGT